jgi:hypothetical protein
VARAPDKSNASQFNVQNYTQSWAANNPFYAAHVNYAFSTADNTRTNAAARSGVVQTAGYTNVAPENRGISANDPMNWASPTRSGSSYDRFGNVNKQVGDLNLGLVLMGGNQFPGQAFMPERGKSGIFSANYLARWMNKQGTGGYSPSGLRARNTRREGGWGPVLSQSLTSNKAPGGVGQSSIDSTVEMYSTQETRLGTRAYFTDEEWNAGTKKYGRSWAGFKPLMTHSLDPHFDSKLAPMFKRESPDGGAARRVAKSRL